VLGGALAAGHRHRVYDAVILKTLGATRFRLLAAYTIEYLLLGTATAVFGVLSGSLAGWLIVTELMHLSFTWLPLPALAAAMAALVVTVVLGLVGTYTALGQKPAPVLRNLVFATFAAPRPLFRPFRYSGGHRILPIRNNACHVRATSGAKANRTLHSSTRARWLSPARLT
jgi:hypothetical protein